MGEQPEFTRASEYVGMNDEVIRDDCRRTAAVNALAANDVVCSASGYVGFLDAAGVASLAAAACVIQRNQWLKTSRDALLKELLQVAERHLSDDEKGMGPATEARSC